MYTVLRRLAAPVAFCGALLTPLLTPLAAPSQPSSTAPVSFEAPAGKRVAGVIDTLEPFSQILPSGRISTPVGKSVVVGMGALGVALTPDDRYAIVSNDAGSHSDAVSAFDGLTRGGSSLAVVDTQTLAVVDRYRAADENFFAGIVALRDPQNPGDVLVLASGGPRNFVYAFDLDANGHLTRDAHHAIAIPAPSDPRDSRAGRAFPSTLVLAADGSRAYVVDHFGDDVASIDTAKRSVSGTTVAVGFAPFGAAVAGSELVVGNEGLGTYAATGDSAAAPPFETPPDDPLRASSLSIVSLDSAGGFTAPQLALPLDRKPDGLRLIGGAHPAAIAAMRSKPYAFVALSNVDRIATIALGPDAPVAVGGTELRLFDRGPYGTQPSALVLSKDEKRLYVALAGINAIAVLDATDPRQLHRLGLIPTGWYPTALALSHDGRSLFVVNLKGVPGGGLWSTLQRIELGSVDLRVSTGHALSYQRALHPALPNAIVPVFGSLAPKSPIKHVVFIVEASKTYDAMLGDLTGAGGAPYGPGDPSLVAYGRDVTPNLHALALTYGLAGNFYADSAAWGPGSQFAAAGTATLFTERLAATLPGPAPYADVGQDPEDYSRAGYIFNALALRDRSFRDYGDFVRVSGFAPQADGQGLGARFPFDAPAPASLLGHVDLNFASWNPRLRDSARAAEFVRDFDALERAGAMPEFSYVSLPGDRGVAGRELPSPAEQVADGDRALGAIVEYLSHLPEWRSTAIFITAGDTEGGRDHIDMQRTYAIVVSPYAKRHYLGMRHASTAGILKTEEEILGLPPLSIGDALATDLGDFFSPHIDVTPFEHIDVPTQ